jgi:hypothetical protein
MRFKAFFIENTEGASTLQTERRSVVLERNSVPFYTTSPPQDEPAPAVHP